MRPDFISSSPLPDHLDCEVIPGGHGSFIVRGRKYDVLNARGPVSVRQDLANKLGVELYIEQHLNAHTSPEPWYACAFIAKNAHARSKQLARIYVGHCADILLVPNGGVHPGPSNCARMRCPAFLAEAGFLSNPQFSRFIRTGEGTEAAAQCLAETVFDFLPDGGLVGLSVGHGYRGNNDPGAPAYVDPDGPEDKAYDDETEIVDGIVNLATELIVSCE